MSVVGYQFVSPDPSRPWPGVARTVNKRETGLANLSDGPWLHLASAEERQEAPVSLLTLPVGALSRAKSIRYWLEAAAFRLSSGGVVVAEEPGMSATSELEPVVLTAESAVLASVKAKHDALDIRVVSISARTNAVADDVTVSSEVFSPLSIAKLHTTAVENGWEILGQWSDWDGAPINDRWRIVALRRV